MIHQRIELMSRPLNYLMGRRGEADFLLRLDPNQELEHRRAAFFAQLSHVVPILTDVPIETILTIRKRDRESFLDYRNAIRVIIADHLDGGGTISEREAGQLYQDIIRPRVEKLMTEAKRQERSRRREVLISAGVPAALLSMGVFGGVLPPHIAELLKIGGTLGLITEGLKTLLATAAQPPNNSGGLYFLLELERASEVSN